MRLWFAMLALAAGANAVAAEPGSAGGTQPAGRMVVLGVGRCDEPLLAEATRALRREVAQSAAGPVLDEEATAAPGGGLPSSSADEVRRLVEQGRSDFLALHVERAERALRQAMSGADRLPLGPERSEAWWSARVHLARVHQYRGDNRQATDLFVEILRVRESFTLSRLEFPPSTRQLLDHSRALVAGLPRFTVTVTTPHPGATVYVNSFAMGKTPLQLALPGGTYSIAAATPQRHSFRRNVTITSETTLQLDPEEEGRLHVDRGPCWELEGDRERRIAGAARVGSEVGADKVVVVRIERLGTDEYVAAALVDLARGSEVREGRLRLESARLPDLARLGRFLLTGEGLEERPPAPAEAVAVGPTTTRSDDSSIGAAATVAPATPLNWPRVGAWALSGAAAVLAGVAVYEQACAHSLARQRAGLLVPGASGAIRPEDLDRAQRLSRSIDATETRRTIFALSAGAAAGASGLIFGLLPTRSGQVPAPGAAVSVRF